MSYSLMWGDSGLAGAVDHPVDAEPVGDTAEIVTPEHFHQRHGDLAAGRKTLEQAVRIGTRIRLQVDVHVVALDQLEAHRIRRIGGHQLVSTQDGQRHVEHQLLVRLRHGWLAGLRGHLAHASDTADELAPEYGPVEQEGFLGVAGEIEVGTDGSHRTLLGLATPDMAGLQRYDERQGLYSTARPHTRPIHERFRLPQALCTQPSEVPDCPFGNRIRLTREEGR